MLYFSSCPKIRVANHLSPSSFYLNLSLICLHIRSAITKIYTIPSIGSVIASCITCVDDGFVFLGSRLGNSLLLRYTEKKTAGVVVTPAKSIETTAEPSQKKRKVDQFDDFDDIEIFGDSNEPAHNNDVVSYAFEVS